MLPPTLSQSLLQFGQGQVGLLPERGSQLLLYSRCQLAGGAMLELLWAFPLPRPHLLRTNFLAVPPTDAKLSRQLPQAPNVRPRTLPEACSLNRRNKLAASTVSWRSPNPAYLS